MRPLLFHPDSPAPPGVRLYGQLHRRAQRLMASWVLDTPLQWLALPPAEGQRQAPTHGLWQASCFEVFISALRAPAPYLEWNIAPNGQWAAYVFTQRRQASTQPEALAWQEQARPHVTCHIWPPAATGATACSPGHRDVYTDQAPPIPATLPPPAARTQRLQLHAVLPPLWGLPPEQPWALGLCAVLKPLHGPVLYAALQHGGPRPDFHDPASRIWVLPA